MVGLEIATTFIRYTLKCHDGCIHLRSGAEEGELAWLWSHLASLRFLGNRQRLAGGLPRSWSRWLCMWSWWDRFILTLGTGSGLTMRRWSSGTLFGYSACGGQNQRCRGRSIIAAGRLLKGRRVRSLPEVLRPHHPWPSNQRIGFRHRRRWCNRTFRPT